MNKRVRPASIATGDAERQGLSHFGSRSGDAPQGLELPGQWVCVTRSRSRVTDSRCMTSVGRGASGRGSRCERLDSTRGWPGNKVRAPDLVSQQRRNARVSVDSSQPNPALMWRTIVHQRVCGTPAHRSGQPGTCRWGRAIDGHRRMYVPAFRAARIEPARTLRAD